MQTQPVTESLRRRPVPRSRAAAPSAPAETFVERAQAAAPVVARGLAWFSLGLGLAELVSPSRLARGIGLRDTFPTRATLRGYGLREASAGLGILGAPASPTWVWARVLGDAADLASLGSAALKGSP